MTNTTQDLNFHPREQCQVIRAEVKHRRDSFCYDWGKDCVFLLIKEDVGAGPYRSRPIRSAVVGLARRTPPVIITARRDRGQPGGRVREVLATGAVVPAVPRLQDSPVDG